MVNCQTFLNLKLKKLACFFLNVLTMFSFTMTTFEQVFEMNLQYFILLLTYPFG